MTTARASMHCAMAPTADRRTPVPPATPGGGQYVVRVDDRILTLAEVAAGRVPDDMTGVRWSDGIVECRANLLAADYLDRRRAHDDHGPDHGVVLTDPSATCERCADKCGG